MSEEEKKALEKALWYFQEVLIHEDDIDQWGVIVNYIEKQQQDIEKLKKVMNVEKVMCENMIGDVEIVCMYKGTFLRNYGDDYISKDKIRELKQSIHNALDENGITRGYQQIIDKYFDELLEEN